MEKFLIQHNRCPGDVTVLTALVRDLAKTYANRLLIGVDTTHPELWLHNPYLTQLQPGPGVRVVKATYGPGLREQNHETIHFCAYFHRDFERQTGKPVKLLEPRPDLHLSAEELHNRLVEGRYWVVIAGGKHDFPVKIPSLSTLQTVVERLRRVGMRFVQCGAAEEGHWHPGLSGVLNLVGKTSLRQFLRILAQADGLICPVTFGMHAAAALEKPCVVLAGGREQFFWEGYYRENKGLGGLEVAGKLRVPHRYLHTIGLLDCCRHRGCWKNKLQPTSDDQSVCTLPVSLPGELLAQCQAMIRPEHVLEAVSSYYDEGLIPPLRSPRQLPQPIG